jgi:Holliday junction resolvase
VKNTRNKGNRNELRCEKELKEKGWKVQRTGYRLFQQNDFFGLFDILAIQPRISKLVQVKSNRKPVQEEIKAMMKFTTNYPQFNCEIWIWIDRKGWKKLLVTTKGLYELTDNC